MQVLPPGPAATLEAQTEEEVELAQFAAGASPERLEMGGCPCRGMTLPCWVAPCHFWVQECQADFVAFQVKPDRQPGGPTCVLHAGPFGAQVDSSVFTPEGRVEPGPGVRAAAYELVPRISLMQP